MSEEKKDKKEEITLEKKSERKVDKKSEKIEEIVMQIGESSEAVDTTRLSTEVVSVLVGVAAGDVAGVAGMSGGIVDGIAEKLGRKDLTKGVKVYLQDGTQVSIELFIIVEYGVNIVEVSQDLIMHVRETIESTTSLDVGEINVHVQGVNLPEDKSGRKNRQKNQELEDEEGEELEDIEEEE